MSKNYYQGINFQAEYKRLQATYGVDPSTGEPTNPKLNTKIGARFDASQTGFEVGARLSDAKDLLSENLKTLADPKSSRRKFNEAVKQINKTVIPVIEIASKSSQDSATKVSPIPAGRYGSKRIDRMLSEENPSKKPRLTRVTEFINNAKSNGPPIIRSPPMSHMNLEVPNIILFNPIYHI